MSFNIRFYPPGSVEAEGSGIFGVFVVPFVVLAAFVELLDDRIDHLNQFRLALRRADPGPGVFVGNREVDGVGEDGQAAVGLGVYLSMLIIFGIGAGTYYKKRHTEAKQRVKKYMRDLSRLEKMAHKKEIKKS